MTRLSRRALLRGAGNVAIALPFLEVMTPRKAHAAEAPKRLFTHFTENGVVHPTWYPSGTEKNFTLNKVHQPFEKNGLKQNLIIFDGLTITQTGGQGSAHMRAKTGNLTAFPNGGGDGRSRGQSIDQAIADKIQGPSRLRSIEAGVFVRGNYRDAMFFSKPGQAALTEDDPTKLFMRVFSGGIPTTGPKDPKEDEAIKAAWLRRKSILDGALLEYKRLSDRATQTDRVRLENHVSAIRDLEKAIAPGGGSGSTTMGCKQPSQPEVGDFVKESRAQQDILLMALACDLTRVANLHYLTNKVVFSWAGVKGGTHHDISHRQKSQSDNLPELDAINSWYADQVCYIVDRLKAMPDVDGRTVFDNTIVFWANELALGSHKFERAPYMMVAGKFPLPNGGTLQTGRYMVYSKGTLQSGLLCSIGQMFGLPITNFGHPMWHQGPLKGLI